MPTSDPDLSRVHVQALSGARRWQQSLGGNRKEPGWAGSIQEWEWAWKSRSQGEQGDCGGRDPAGAKAPSAQACAIVASGFTHQMQMQR